MTALGARALAQALSTTNMDLSLVDHLLPESIKEIATLVGYQKALHLIATIPGTSWVFARYEKIINASDKWKTSEFDEFVEITGDRELALTLCRYYDGERVYIAICSDALRVLRDIAIHRYAEAGIESGRSMLRTVRMASIKFGLSDRAVWRILKRPCPTNQGAIEGKATRLMR